MAHVRPFSPEFADQWCRLRHALWPDGSVAEHRADVERFLAGDRREPAEVLLAFDGEQVVGFVELSIRNIVDSCTSDRVAYLEGWYVSPETRRRGIGALLIGAAEQWARAQGCQEFGSDALLDNEISHIAHRALGFEETSRVVTYRKGL